MIYCVEDDASIRDIEVYALTSTGFEAEGFGDGSEFFAAVKKKKPELVILDVMLPGTDGVEILKKLKASPDTADIAVIMATAKGTEYDKIKSLDIGADDYLVKPFGMMEMVSRVKAVLRRCRPKSEANVLRSGGLEINLDEHIVDGGRGENRAHVQGVRAPEALYAASGNGVHARPALFGRLGDGLLRRDADGRYAHKNSQAEARKIRRAHRHRPRRRIPL